MTITDRSTPLSRHLRMIAGELEDTHAAASINTAADILEAIAEKPAMTVNAQTMLELAEQLREFTALKYAGDCKCGKCQLVPRAFIDRLYSALRSPAIAGVEAREALERIIKIDRHEKKIMVETDPAGNTYRVEMIDGPCATVARDALAALPPSQEVPALIPAGKQARFKNETTWFAVGDWHNTPENFEYRTVYAIAAQPGSPEGKKP